MDAYQGTIPDSLNMGGISVPNDGSHKVIGASIASTLYMSAKSNRGAYTPAADTEFIAKAIVLYSSGAAFQGEIGFSTASADNDTIPAGFTKLLGSGLLFEMAINTRVEIPLPDLVIANGEYLTLHSGSGTGSFYILGEERAV